MEHAADGPDRIDKLILDVIQSGFPIASDPYELIAREVNGRGGTAVSADEVLNRVSALRRCGVIRRMGANFQSARLGFRSTLCAAKVPQEKISMFKDAVNAMPGVTHNYLRKHEYNMWFTLIAPSWENACEQLEKLQQKTGISVLNLPAKKMFKIRVDFAMADE